MDERRRSGADEALTGIDRLRLFANDPKTFPFSIDDAEDALHEYDHYKNIAEEGTAPLLKSMKLENGEFNMDITGPIVEVMACAFVGQFKAGGSVNYMEMSLFDRDEPYQRYTLTVQKVGAKSPADLVDEARARIAELEDELEEANRYEGHHSDEASRLRYPDTTGQ
ncbi:hypothetical protein CN090_04415 [Sinorhizobium meliloti]|uniref:hypothetical protein n=1 Tax=Rhizobium meliloti TaxID=382 RepID=UPI000FDB271D|nr:hypothetical protein [Sinorhizobium meliloti]RVO55166.1 hypothetical protein CN090_04415 [Sinorhizobium meliloti]